MRDDFAVVWYYFIGCASWICCTHNFLSNFSIWNHLKEFQSFLSSQVSHDEC